VSAAASEKHKRAPVSVVAWQLSVDQTCSNPAEVLLVHERCNDPNPIRPFVVSNLRRTPRVCMMLLLLLLRLMRCGCCWLH
jgi:hypothetical protein